MRLGLTILGLAGVALTAAANGEVGVKSSSPAGYHSRGILMFENRNYVGAIDQMSHLYMMEGGERHSEDADFYIASATYERGDANCIEMFEKFIVDHPASVYVPYAWARIGDTHFFNGKYGEALTAYRNIEPSAFNRHYKQDISYRVAYSLLKVGEYDRARLYFDNLSRTKRYRQAGVFFDAYLDYVAKDYGQASEKFANIAPSTELGKAARYYQCQIDFVDGDYDRVISTGRQLIGEKSASDEYRAEMNRIVGESYYQRSDDMAEQYLQRYMESSDADPARSTSYIMGVLSYRNADWQQAIDHLSAVTDGNDELAQSAYLFVGQSYLKLGNANAASIAFEKALNMTYNQDIRETAFYNYAISQNEGGRTPFNRSIDIFEQFLNQYPQSRYASDVEDYLINAYTTGNDYPRALQSIERISRPSSKVLAAKQNVLYQMGVQALSNDDTATAMSYFKQSRAVGSYDKQVANNCQLWLAECQYRQGEYAQAERSLNAYIASAPSSEAGNVAMAQYSLGYARFQQRNYSGARQALAKAVAHKGLDTAVKADALARIGDTYYYGRDYEHAQQYYEQAYTTDSSTGDYALYQKAMMLGLQRDYKAKINMLDQLLRQYSRSPLCSSALLQKAESYVNLGNSASAIDTYKLLISQYPGSADARKGLLQMAITERNAGNQDRAIEAYKNVIKQYPTSEEAAVASEDLKLIYADAGRLAEYTAFMKSVPNAPQVDVNDLDRLAFEAAEKAYLERKGIGRLEDYLKSYPQGAFVAKAKYYIAYSKYEAGDYDGALAMANEVLASGQDATYAPDALRIKGDVLMRQARAAEAAEAYQLMAQKATTQQATRDAQLGLMRASLLLNRFADMRDAADQLLKMGGLQADDEKEVRYSRATANLKLGSGNAAVADLEILARDPRNIYGAQAAYDLADYYYANGDNVGAENTLNSFIEAGTPHQYWMARAFILLADVYHKKGKNFEAKQYLKSLKDNYPGSESDIFEMIDSRLSQWGN